MAVASTADVWRLGLASTTVRQFRRAVGLALLAVAVGCLLYGVETLLLRPRHRFVENPAAVMMRACGLAHFWIGWLFLFTSPRLRNRPALGRLLALTGVGIALCVGCALSGATRNPFVFLFFYGFFLVHEVRDQTHLFQAYGDAPTHPESRALLDALSRAAALFLVSVLTCGYVLHLGTSGKLIGWEGTQAFLGAGTVVLFAASCWAVAAVIQLGCRIHGSALALLASHRPLLLVYAGIFVILLLGAACGAVVFNLIILIHAAAWLLFIQRQLRQRPTVVGRNSWLWLRCTPHGFLVLHLGVVLLILVLMGLRVHAWQRVGLLSDLLAGSSFPYWSLMHISMSFWRSR